VNGIFSPAQFEHYPKEKTMVSKVSVPKFMCDICRSKHNELAGAVMCEKQGVQNYKFIKYEVVKAGLGDNKQIIAIINCPGWEDEHLTPHGDLSYYDIEVHESVATSGKVPPHGRFSTCTFASWIEPHTQHDASCPLCGTRSTAAVDTYYSGEIIPGKSVLIPNAQVTECPSCKLSFFTQTQLEAVKKQIMEESNIPDEVDAGT
jgi:hypothetical protein